MVIWHDKKNGPSRCLSLEMTGNMFGSTYNPRLFTHTLIACPIFGSNWCKLYCFSHQTADFGHRLSRNRSKIATAPRRWHKVRAQRKIPVVFNFPHYRHEVSCASYAKGLAQLAGVLISGLWEYTVFSLLIFLQWRHIGVLYIVNSQWFTKTHRDLTADLSTVRTRYSFRILHLCISCTGLEELAPWSVSSTCFFIWSQIR